MVSGNLSPPLPFRSDRWSPRTDRYLLRDDLHEVEGDVDQNRGKNTRGERRDGRASERRTRCKDSASDRHLQRNQSEAESVQRMLADVSVEWTSSFRGLLKRRTARSCAVGLTDGELGRTVFELGLQPKPLQLRLGKVRLHTKWISKGRMTIVFEDQGVNVLLSEAIDRELKELALLLCDQGKCTSISKVSVPKSIPIGKRECCRSTNHNVQNSKFPIKSCDPSARGRTACRSQTEAVGNECLTSSQKKVVELVKSGKSVFFTGSAGTGKSMLLRSIIRSCESSSTYATATTGLAASLIGGTTINSFAGIGRAEGTVNSIISRVSRGEASKRWKNAKVLIIDEVSMLDANTFDLLEAIARSVRNNELPFGGIQLVLSGDFYQLPPVHKGKHEATFAFESDRWKCCVNHVVELTEVFRQHDPLFVRMLNELRKGTCTAETIRQLQKCSHVANFSSDGILPTRLCTHRKDLHSFNETCLKELEGQCMEFNAIDTGPQNLIDSICPAATLLKLKVGAQVVLIKTLDVAQKLVNGSRGVVVGFAGSLCLPIVKFASGAELTIHRETWVISTNTLQASRSQIPLQLAWALSIHKSQGMSLDRVTVALGKVWEYGQAYVALSRVRSLEGLQISGSFSRECIKAHPKVQEFYQQMQFR